MRDEVAAPVRLSEYRPLPYRIDDISLDFDLAPERSILRTIVKARSHVRKVAGGEGGPLVLDGVHLELERVAIDGKELAPSDYVVEPERLIIHTPPDVFTLDITTFLHPASNTALEGLYVSAGRFCTQCEAEGFRKITYALDRPDSLSRYKVRMEANKALYPTLLSNGDPIEQGDLPGGRHFAVWRDPHPKPAYLFALVAGAFDSVFDTFTTSSGRNVALGVHVDQGEGARAHYAMDALKRAMKWDEEVFAREYDLDVFNIVAVRDFNFGAMENKGLNIFNSSNVLADPETATDDDYQAIESIVAHEYFHNWTGNRITLRDWFQLCLKEGLTVFRDQEFSADQRSRPVQRIKDVRMLRLRQFPEDGGPLAHAVRPVEYRKSDNFYTATVYEKGAELVRMLAALIGPDAFARGMQLYFKTCDGAAATVEDFVGCFAEASGRDLAQFLRWYAQAGTPRVTARSAYDATTKRLSLTLTQSTPPTPGQADKAPVPIPLRLGLLAPDGAPLTARLAGAEPKAEHEIVLAAGAATFVFDDVAEAPTPSYLRGFSAPVLLDDGLTPAQRLTQMTHDPDAVTRWEAGQVLQRAAILAEAGIAPMTFAPADLADALGRELDRAQQDSAFAALALRAPDLADLIQHVERPDPEALFQARERVRKLIAAALEPRLLALAGRTPDQPFSPDGRQAGGRALKASALDLLSALGTEHVASIEQAFHRAATMSERMAALDALGRIDGPEFDRALAAFFERYKERPLVVDKWFSVQSAAPRSDAAARVERLKSHPLFTIGNPNRARSVVGAFSVRNLRAFHAADGSGYRFLADFVRAADPLNPALAARMLSAFETWRRFDPGRQEQARAALQSLVDEQGLSKNAREMVERTLA